MGTARSSFKTLHILALCLVAAALCLTTLAASAQKTIKLGFIGPLSGGNSLQGIGAKNAFLLAIQQANQSGYPYHVEGVALDDGSQASGGVHAALKLINEPDMVGVTCCWNSPVALAIMPLFSRANIPLIVWGAISPKITQQNIPQVTRDTPTLAKENKPLAKWLVKDLGYKRISILSTTDNYGENDLKYFEKYAKQNGATIVSVDALPSDETNFKSVLTKIKHKKPELLYFGGVIAPAALARKQMKSVGLDIPMAGISGIYDPKLIELAGQAANGTLVTEPKVQANPRLKAFNKAYKKADFSNPPGPYGKYAYDATNILLHVIKKHGLDDPNAVVKAIRAIHYQGVVGTTTFNAHGQTQIPITTDHYIVQNGKWIPYEQSRKAKKTDNTSD
jgi:branched-chain amino acid transport system substrate-binding protein